MSHASQSFAPFVYRNPGPMRGQTRMEHFYAKADTEAPVPQPIEVVEIEDDRLDPSQQAAVDAAVAGKNLFLTGPAGCGKSFTIGCIVGALEDSGHRVRVTSSTGVSAILLDMGATTIHGLFAMGDTGDRPAEAYARKLRQPHYKRIYDMLRVLNTLIIDEVSMVPNALFRKVDLLLQLLKGSGQPFGGVQLILSGDFAQLPKVTGAKRGGKRARRVDEEDVRMLFATETWERAGIETMLLRTDHRQMGDPAYAGILHRARMGRMTNADVTALKARQLRPGFGPEADDHVTFLLPTNAAVDQTNTVRLAELDPATEHVYHAETSVTATCVLADTGDRRGPDVRPPTMTEVEKQALEFLHKNRAAPAISLRLGARVMLLRNVDVEEGLGNGTLGQVVGWASASPNALPLVQFSGRSAPCVVDPYRWSFPDNGVWKGWYEQVPLTLAWAVTIHKCVAGRSLVPVAGRGLCRMEDLCAAAEPGVSLEQRKGHFTVATEQGTGRATQIYRAPDPQTPTLVIETQLGFQIECSAEHPIRTVTTDPVGRVVGCAWTEAQNVTKTAMLKLRVGTCAHGEESGLDANMAWRMGIELAAREWQDWSKRGEIMRSNLAVQTAFLHGIFGLAERRTLKLPPVARAVFESETNARDTQVLMANVGYIGSIKKEGRAKWVVTWVPTTQRTLGFLYDYVRSIRWSQAPVYDLYVPGPHSFICGAFVTHNSQGTTLSRVVANLRARDICWPGAGYTAMSRVRSLHDIWFATFERAAVWPDQEVIGFYDSLNL